MNQSHRPESTSSDDAIPDPAAGRGKGHKAGAFDVRNVIAALLGVYGVILLLMGLFADTDPAHPGESNDVNANLWAGIALLVVTVLFAGWARLRPIVVPDQHHDA